MARYLVQVLYMRYIEVEEDQELFAVSKANEEMETLLDLAPLSARDFTYTVTDELENEEQLI